MQDNDDFKYVSVMFEDRINSTPENPKFYGKDYLYKTKRVTYISRKLLYICVYKYLK